MKIAVFATALAWSEVKEETLRKSWHKLWLKVIDDITETSKTETV